ncbi:MAG: hypothetical protein HQL53_11150 [Magnetococcales bacterium]|nr:hypothetical protein [Magnetococcales bacterium]
MWIERAMVQRRVVLFLLVLAAAMACLYAASRHLDQQAIKAKSTSRDVKKLRNRVSNAATELAQIERYLPSFKRLRKEGFIGTDHRQAWVERLSEEARRIGIGKLSFNLDPSKSISGAWVPKLVAIQAQVNPMTLDMELLHELDLLKLLQALEGQEKSRFTTATCVIKAKGEKLDLRAAKPNLTAKCLLLWYSVILPSTEGG